ncbi:MAG: LysR family transcriptional regulator [Pseudomonadales bacterium]|jgi:LysR family hydrogen peroxide-inducible transcriptional activator|nr:LysR family transcriptional regulator [Pseudomonadales bacterium]MCC6528778.1 LysR family transcriptional regulator [Pseudomonadales bacterium]MCP5331866.1 LysR family transcriptional regulator [Pseudomonadales bacterium]HMU89844.1 LysR substrate-binding domain-containing protein [Pseudomonadales bacterium]HMW14924.1 LysR substrate-binding domain-containing protein [Pseudomonadales bacterium]
MTLNELRYLVALARERHFGRAADTCFVTQPTLSVAIKKIEGELGITLFERNASQVTLTEAGIPIVTQAQRVLDELALLRSLAQEMRNPLELPVRIGAIHTIGPYLFPALIPRLREQAPKLPLQITEGTTDVLLSQLRLGELDLLVLALPFAQSGLTVRPLYDEPLLLALPHDHPWNQRDTIDIDALGHERMLLLGEGHCLRRQVLELCPNCLLRSEERRAQPTLIGNSLETLCYMVAAGNGVTVLPATAVHRIAGEERGLMTVRPFTAPAPQRRVVLAWRNSFSRNALTDLVAEAIQQVSAPLGARITADG